MPLVEGIGCELEDQGTVIVAYNQLAVADRTALLVDRAGSRHAQVRRTGPGARHSLVVAGHIVGGLGSLAVDNRPAHSLVAVGSPGLEVGTVDSLGCIGRRVLTFWVFRACRLVWRGRGLEYG